MVKISSHAALDILRRYEIANDDTKIRDIENLKISHPRTTNTLVTFKFAKQLFGILFDEEIADNKTLLSKEISFAMPNFDFEIVKNPTESETSYGIPYKNRSCYLFTEKFTKKRIDAILSKRYPEISRSTWQKYIKAGYIKVSGNLITSPRTLIYESESITKDIPDATNYDSQSLPVVYSDSHVIVVNKPAGVLTHSKGVLNEEFTVADFFRRYTTYNIDTNRAGIVHRLDRDTSGIIIGALDDETAKLLQKQFADRKTKKTYYAIVKGTPKHQKAIVDLPIERNPSKPSTFRVGSNGKNAITRYDVIASSNGFSLIKLQPSTGRTHQLRVHMAHIGHPILGDRVYGKAEDRLYLHAYSLEITIPISNRTTFTAPLPTEFKKYFPELNL